MRGPSQILLRGAFGAMAMAAVGARADVDQEALKNIDSYLKFVQETNVDLLNALSSANIDPADRPAIARYYNGVRLHYLERPLSEFMGAGVPQAMRTYTTRVANAIDEMRSGVVDTRKVMNCVEESSELSLSEFRRAGQQASNQINELQTALSTPINLRQPALGTYWTGGKDLSYALKTLQWDVGSAMASCCKKGNYRMRDASEDEQKVECEAMAESIASAKSSFNGALSSVSTPTYRMVPNPLSLPKLTAEDVALIVQDHSAATRIAKARSSSEDDEQDIFSEMSRCRDRVLVFQEKKNPIPKAVISNIGKMLKCQMIPYIATQNWKTGNQRLAVAFGSAPIQGKDWDMNCGQQEMANWAAMRSDNIAEIDQKWGIPQLENPPYTQGMRNLPSAQSRYAMDGLTAEDIARLVPNATTAASYVKGRPNSLSPMNAGGQPISGSRSPTSGGSRRLAFTMQETSSPGISAQRGAGSMRGSFSRGNDRGLELVQATRTAAAFVRKNERAEFYASRIQSGARNTRSFLASAGRRIRITGPAEVSRARTKEAGTIAAYTARATSARASRATTEGVLGALQESGAKTTLRPVSTTVRNEEDRELITKKIQGYLNNIEVAKKGSDKANREIITQLVERQNIIDSLRAEYKDEPDAVQAELVLEARRKIKQIDIDLGALRMDYNTYQMAILEQDGLIQRLVTFGLLPGSSGSNSGSGRGTATGNTSGDSLPDGFDASSGRGSQGWAPRFLELINPIRSAWAEVKGALGFEEHWAQEWARFKREYGDYVEGKRRAERELAAEGAALWAEHRASATIDGVYEVDTENLVTQDLFLREIVEESEHIISLERKRELTATPRAIASMRQAKADAEEARKLWIEHQKTWFESLPQKPEQNAEALWSLVPDFFLY
jgi:hypothetical protein